MWALQEAATQVWSEAMTAALSEIGDQTVTKRPEQATGATWC